MTSRPLRAVSGSREVIQGNVPLIEGAGHLCYLDTPSIINSAIIDMVQRCFAKACP